MNDDWILSENSFLKVCCNIQDFSWGSVYDWPEDTENHKLQFIRLLKLDFTPSELHSIWDQWHPLFSKRKLPTWFKAKDDLPLPIEVPLKTVGKPLMFLRTAATNKESLLPQLELKQAKTFEEFQEWWILYSTYPTRSEKLASPFFPYAKQFWEKGTAFYLMFDRADPIAGFALDAFTNSKGEPVKNLWGVITREDWRGKGVYKEFESRVLAHLDSKFYLQTIENSNLHLYYKKSKQTDLLARQLRYEWEYKTELKS